MCEYGHGINRIFLSIDSFENSTIWLFNCYEVLAITLKHSKTLISGIVCNIVYD